MILSHKHELIFIRLQKVAGSSLCTYLLGTDQQLIKTCVDKSQTEQTFGRELDPHHIPAADIKMYLGEEIYYKYKKIAFVRNPWDRMKSIHKYRKIKMEFNEWILYGIEKGFDKWWANIDMTQSSFIGPDVDYIGKFEKLQQDWDHIHEVLQLPKPKWQKKPQGTWIPHINPTCDAIDMPREYNQETYQKLGEKYHDDIKRFGYC